MATGSFEKNNLGWQLYQLQQRLGEWWELNTANALSKAPALSWLDSPVLQIIAKAAFWLISCLLITWVVWQLWQLLRPYIYNFSNPLSQSDDKLTKTRTRELSAAAWLQRSQKFQQQGNYREACQCLYMAMLQRLNDTGLVQHEPSRTDGEYLQLLIQQLPQPRPYQTLLMAHQQLCFSNVEASPSLFEQCQQAYREIEAS